MSDLVPIWQESHNARWLVSVASEHEEGSDWSGWSDIDADARAGTVEFGGTVYTVEEARNMAEAFRQAADHAENFGRRANRLLFELVCPGQFPEIDGMPSENQRAIRDALRAAGDRYWKPNYAATDAERGASDKQPQ